MNGVHGYAGEFGHMVVNPAGERCGCGRIGCWETEVGELHIARRIIREIENGVESTLSRLLVDGPSALTISAIVQAVEDNDALATTMLGQLREMLGLGLANLVNIFNTDMIVLGGVFRSLRSTDFEIINAIVEREALAGSTVDLQILPARIDMNDACVLGAAALILDDILRVPAFSAFR